MKIPKPTFLIFGGQRSSIFNFNLVSIFDVFVTVCINLMEVESEINRFFESDGSIKPEIDTKRELQIFMFFFTFSCFFLKM